MDYKQEYLLLKYILLILILLLHTYDIIIVPFSFLGANNTLSQRSHQNSYGTIILLEYFRKIYQFLLTFYEFIEYFYFLPKNFFLSVYSHSTLLTLSNMVLFHPIPSQVPYYLCCCCSLV